ARKVSWSSGAAIARRSMPPCEVETKAARAVFVPTRKSERIDEAEPKIGRLVRKSDGDRGGHEPVGLELVLVQISVQSRVGVVAAERRQTERNVVTGVVRNADLIRACRIVRGRWAGEGRFVQRRSQAKVPPRAELEHAVNADGQRSVPDR